MTFDEIGTPAGDEHENQIIKDLAVGPKARESTRDRIERYVLYFVLLAVFVGGPSVYVTYKLAHTTQENLSALCPAFRDIATVTIPPPTPSAPPATGTPTSVQIVGDFRNAYDASCVSTYGPLPVETDNRVLEYLASKHRH